MWLEYAYFDSCRASWLTNYCRSFVIHGSEILLTHNNRHENGTIPWSGEKYRSNFYRFFYRSIGLLSQTCLSRTLLHKDPFMIKVILHRIRARLSGKYRKNSTNSIKKKCDFFKLYFPVCLASKIFRKIER